MGLLVDKWPAGLGADASGVIVDAGKVAQEKYGFKKGDYVCGCTRIGMREYSTAREYFLMDAQVTMRKPSNLSLADAATIGAASQTAAFGIFAGLDIAPPKKGSSAKSNEWVLVLGGAGSVGRAGVQLAKAAGCKVIASASEKSFDTVKKLGADAVFDYHLPLDEQVKAVEDATGGQPVTKIFDATSAENPALAKELFRSSKDAKKYFSTTNDWSGIGDFEGGKTYEIHLGQLGRPGPDAKEINSAVEAWNPVITYLYESGVVLPHEQDVVGKGGIEDAITAYKHKAGSKKVVVKLQDE